MSISLPAQDGVICGEPSNQTLRFAQLSDIQRAQGTALAVRAHHENLSVSRFRLDAAMPQILPIAAAWLLGLNLWTVLRFWQDKSRARNGERRIPEADLLTLAILGGSPGALLARRLFRHKTQKEPFSTMLLVIVALQIGAVAGFVIL